MDKSGLNCFKIALIFTVSILLTNCHFKYEEIVGNGKQKTEKRKLNQDFKSVKISESLTVHIIQSPEVALEIKADENILKHIITSVENGQLNIYVSSDVSIDSNPMIELKMPLIEKLMATSGAKIITKAKIKGQNLTVETSSGAMAELNTAYDAVKLESSSGSGIQIKGLSLNLTSSASSGSTIKAKELMSNNVKAEANSGSMINVYPILNLTAVANSGGGIEYHNTPKKIQKETNSGGFVEQQ